MSDSGVRHQSNTVRTINQSEYCKRITFGDVFFLAPLVVESPRKIKYTTKCALIKVRISDYKSTTKSNPH